MPLSGAGICLRVLSRKDASNCAVAASLMRVSAFLMPMIVALLVCLGICDNLSVALGLSGCVYVPGTAMRRQPVLQHALGACSVLGWSQTLGCVEPKPRPCATRPSTCVVEWRPAAAVGVAF